MSATLRINICNWSALLLTVLLLFTPGYTQREDLYPKLKSVQIVSEDFLSSRPYTTHIMSESGDKPHNQFFVLAIGSNLVTKLI